MNSQVRQAVILCSKNNAGWGQYGIHGTIYPDSIGSAASHGCIRMYNKDMAELYDFVPIGTPVTIVNGSFDPFGRRFADINPGDRGANVYAVQRRRKELGFFKGYVDGIYGEGTKWALYRFQKSRGMAQRNTIGRKELTAMGFREFE